MNSTLVQRAATASTTRISTDMEQMWRNQFFAEQGRTPAESFVGIENTEPEINLRQMTKTVKFAGGAYDPAIIKFYEDIIIELQKEVERYKALWESLRSAAEGEAAESYVARQTVQPSLEFARKLRRSTRPALRLSAE
jgi:hypothetical protein